MNQSDARHPAESTGRTLLRAFQGVHDRLSSRHHWYKRWHTHPHHKRVHYSAASLWLVVALAGIILSVSIPGSSIFAADNKPVTGTASVVNTGVSINFNVSPYGSNVVIDNDTKVFAGYAWSEDLGWLAFSGADNPSGPVQVDATSGKVTGVATFLRNNSTLDFNALPFGSNVMINTNGVFSGYAWSGDLGWVNFTGVSVSGVTFGNPNAPSNVQAYDVSDRALADYAILVRWQQPTSFDAGNFNAYLVERSTDGVSYTQQSSTTSRAYFDTNVVNGTLYYYRVKTQNTTGAIATSAVVTMTATGKFTTPPNLVSGPTFTVTPTSLTVKWVTDRESSSFVQIKEGNSFVSEQGQTEQVTDHTVTVVGLRSQKSYAFNVLSTDIDGNTFQGAETAFNTGSLPSIYEATATNITLSSAIISFKSSSIANFTLYYGTTSAYGSQIAESSGSQTTNHSIALTGLKPGTVYFYRLIGDDADGNELRNDNSFQTLPEPSISEFTVTQVPDQPSTTLKLTWTTNVPTTTTAKYGLDGLNYAEKTTSQLVELHEVTVSDLADNSTYRLFAEGTDQFGNTARSSLATFATPTDSRAPKISEIKIESSSGSDQASAEIIVAWTTDEPSTSQVEFAEGSGNATYTNRSSENSALTNKHLVVISGLSQGKPYHLRVLSKDNSGNLTTSADYTTVTGQITRSALQVILQALSNIFGWLDLL